MSIFRVPTRQLINVNVIALAMPILLVAILVGLFVSSAKIAYPKISSQISELDEAGGRLAALEEKLGILRQVKDKVLGAADTSLVALPGENAGVWKLSQIALLAEENEVTVNQRKVLAEAAAGNDLQSTKITFVVSGSLDKTIAFLKSLVESIPIVTLESVEVEGNRESIQTKVGLLVYRSELPTLLPAITAPIKNLSDKEEELLDALTKLSRPEFTSLEPSGPFERIDPFN